MNTPPLRPWFRTAVVAAAIGLPALHPRAQSALPAELTDSEFRDLISSLSEPASPFEHGSLKFSSNFVSNEYLLHRLAPSLTRHRDSGTVYIGVGPEQNFTYVAVMTPAMAFVVDIRRENRDLHLLYKAVFELAETRREFLERLFSRTIAPAPPEQASAGGLLRALAAAERRAELFDRHLGEALTHLIDGRELPLSDAERRHIEAAYRAFFEFGPRIRYWSGSGTSSVEPTFEEMVTATDESGASWSFLSSEERYRQVRALHMRNLIVPVIGDFAGPTALRSLGAWLRARRATVGAFYASNVEVFLVLQKRWESFCRNVATLPRRDGSVVLRTARLQRPLPADVLQSFSVTPDTDGLYEVRFADGRRDRLTREEILAESSANAEIVPLTSLTRTCASATPRQWPTYAPPPSPPRTSASRSRR